MGLIVGILWVGIITVDAQVPGEGTGVSTLRPPVAGRTLIDGSARFSAHAA